MPPPGDNQDIGVGELSRQVREVLIRFEGLAARLETQFVRNDNFVLYKEIVNQALSHLQTLASGLREDVDKLPTTSHLQTLEQRIKDLEDDRRWLTRTVIGFIITAVLGAVFVAARLTGG